LFKLGAPLAYSIFSDVFDGKSRARSHNYAARGHHYDSNQPRIPAGHSDGGQWTANGGYHTQAEDGVVISDATPDNEWLPGAQYASRARSTRSGSPPTGGQALRLVAADARAREAVRAVQERDPDWKPRQSVYSTVEGHIAALEARSDEAEARLAELVRRGFGAGPYERESIRAPSHGRRLNQVERDELNRIGDRWGCHTCGTTDPGQPLENWHADHQLPTAINRFFGREQRILPHCPNCSRRQGGSVTQWLLKRKWVTE
jgi:hypothetical protein